MGLQLPISIERLAFLFNEDFVFAWLVSREPLLDCLSRESLKSYKRISASLLSMPIPRLGSGWSRFTASLICREPLTSDNANSIWG